jgi:vacuolar-type H+-ATPase catalytic subunit A/Vma1
MTLNSNGKIYKVAGPLIIGKYMSGSKIYELIVIFKK